MTLEERVKKLEAEMSAIARAENVSFIESIKRRLEGRFKLSDLSDVSDTDGATTGQVLKKTDGDWQPGTDNTA